MAKKLYVYSTLTADMKYGPYISGHNDVPQRDEHVLIKGKAGITTDRFYTPKGVVTEITEAQYELLKQDSVFLLHEKNGHVVVDEDALDADLMAESMEKDPSAPLEEKDFKEPVKEGETQIKPVVPKAK